MSLLSGQGAEISGGHHLHALQLHPRHQGNGNVVVVVVVVVVYLLCFLFRLGRCMELTWKGLL